jgi:tripartite-type tricarboxylate transporter receptor subunit TctC
MKHWIAAMAICGAAFAAAAQPFPNRALTIVVPFPAGGPSDALARQIAARLGPRLGQTVVVENVGGAGGTIGTAKVAKAAPDGHTLVFGTIGTFVANVALYRKLPYDPLADFEPVGFAGSAPLVLIAHPSLPAATLPEFVAHTAQHKDKLSYGSAGIGSISHYGCVMLLAALKRDITHVPYRGVAPAMNDLAGGQVQFMCDQTTSALPMIQSGRVKAIAALTRQRIDVLPALPTAAEAGYGDVDVRSWNALFVPKATPPAAVKRLGDELSAVMQDPEFRAAMAKLGVDLPAGDLLAPARVTATIQRGLAHDVPALKARGEYLD